MGGPRTGTVAVAGSGSATPCSRPPLSSSLLFLLLFSLSPFLRRSVTMYQSRISASTAFYNPQKSLAFFLSLFLPLFLILFSVYLSFFLSYLTSAAHCAFSLPLFLYSLLSFLYLFFSVCLSPVLCPPSVSSAREKEETTRDRGRNAKREVKGEITEKKRKSSKFNTTQKRERERGK